MKKLTLTFALVAFSMLAFAQGEPFNKFYAKYADNEQFTQVTVTSKMFSLFTNIEAGDPNEKEVIDAMSKLKGLKVLAADSSQDARKFYKEAAAGFAGSAYEELMSVKNGKDDMKFMIKEANGKISELLMLVGGDTKFFFLSLYGEIDLKQISKISKSMNIDGMQYLENAGDDPKNKKKN